ncbi:hypothetical protein RJ640_021286 [Escallonia rubra]|uniref:BED-type domain-containing protein n=1 Tax=Escallonia rubra TaxID=112253 RepID=A0AA88S943_9ASTE|nr:hypothetical protein RJ640_021286 [Escallonia rubra]
MALFTDNNEPPNSDQQPNKRKRKKSMVWDHFTTEPFGDQVTRACCNQCKKSFAYITGSKVAGTSHLKRHIQGTCPVSRQQNQYIPSTPELSANGIGRRTGPPRKRYRSAFGAASVPFDQESCSHEIAKMIILHEYPLHIVEHRGFIDFVRTLQPQFNMVSSSSVEGDCVGVYLKEKQGLLNVLNGLPGRVSLTMDLWTSDHGLGYVLLSGHFIDADWKFHRRILNVVMLPLPFSEVSYNHAVVTCLSHWSLDSKIFTVTLDESFANEAVRKNLGSLLWDKNPHILNGQLLMGNCYARVLSRLAQHALGSTSEIVKRVRDSVMYVKTLEAHEERFIDLKQQLQVPSTKSLIIDDQTKWDTTYHMLAAAWDLKEVFSCLDTSDPNYKPTPSMDEWDRVETLCIYLKILFNAAKILIAPTYPTANTFFHKVWEIQLELARAARSPDTFTSNLTKPLQEMFDIYWKDCYLVLAVALVMDPRYKMKLVEFSLSRIYCDDAETWIKSVDDFLRRLFLEYDVPLLPPPTFVVDEEEGVLNAEISRHYSQVTPFTSYRHESGDMNYARQVFETIPQPNVFLWNTVIRGYSRTNSARLAVSMYVEMLRKNVKPDNYTHPFLIKGFSHNVALEFGKSIHAHIHKFGFCSHVIMQNALIHMYCLCGQIDVARGSFDMSLKADVITWNAMISGYNRSKRFDESKKLFNLMGEKSVLPTLVTLVSVLSACSKSKDLDAAKQVHQYINDHKIDSNLILDNALVNTYASCGKMDVALGIFASMKMRDAISWTTIVAGFVNSGQVDLARNYFDQMPERDSVSWTAMIDGYLRLNQFKDVLMLFRDMQTAKIEPDEFTMVSILTACANLGTLELGEWIKAYIDKSKIKHDVYVGNALIDMYYKCGSAAKAVEVFHKMPRKDKFTWTAMIVGFSVNGQGKEALDMFSQMLTASVKPDQITYIGVLCACTHSGMVDEGRKFFASMTTQHGVEPNISHYGCMVDLLGRAGNLREAYEVIKNMPLTPNSVVWTALLGACKVHKDAEMAEIAAKQLLLLEPDNEVVYVLLCNTYAACNRWLDLCEIRKLMTDRGIKKSPGCSLIEMNGSVHEFVAGDWSHPQSEDICSELEKMTDSLKSAGYLPDISEVFPPIGEEDTEGAVKSAQYKILSP